MGKIAEAGKEGAKLAKQVGRVVYWGVRLVGLFIFLAGLGLWFFTGIHVIWPLAVSGVGLLALFPYVPLAVYAYSVNLVAIATGLVFMFAGLVIFTEGEVILAVAFLGTGLLSVLIGVYTIWKGYLIEESSL